MSASLICYDIRDKKRLARVHRRLQKDALPLQYSVFLFIGTELMLKRCLHDLEKLIKPSEDDLRCYHLPNEIPCEHLGRGFLPDGIIWAALPNDRLSQL